jgi:hypothetical protein
MEKLVIAGGTVTRDGQAPVTSVRDDMGSDRRLGQLESVKVRDHWVDEARGSSARGRAWRTTLRL